MMARKYFGKNSVMGDVFDYLSFFLCSLFLVVLKIAGFVNWDWWITAIPAGFGLLIHLLTVLASR